MPELRCRECGAPLSPDEFAMTRKMINRALQEGFCLPCLARHFQVSEDILREKIIEFKKMGCTLFDQSSKP